MYQSLCLVLATPLSNNKCPRYFGRKAAETRARATGTDSTVLCIFAALLPSHTEILAKFLSQPR